MSPPYSPPIYAIQNPNKQVNAVRLKHHYLHPKLQVTSTNIKCHIIYKNRETLHMAPTSSITLEDLGNKTLLHFI